jgi:clan AA aspartic protease (TIGR02281 family)
MIMKGFATAVVALTVALVVSACAVPAMAWTKEIVADQHGFHTNAWVNGIRIWFHVDTGADSVVLTYQDAMSANVRFTNTGSSITADGSVVTHWVGIADTISIDGVMVRNLRVIVIPGADENLLGMSFLRQVGEIRIEGNHLIIDTSRSPSPAPPCHHAPGYGRLCVD